MDDNKFQIDVLTRLTAIETLLKEQDYKAINERLNQTENISRNNKERLDKLESNLKWVWTTIGGALIVAAVKIIFKI